jgi:pimeloyl-ACP methyl ester carboxylesterase
MKKRLLTLSLALTTLFAGNTYAQRYLTNQFTGVKVTSDIVYGQNYSVLTGAPVLSDLKLDFYEPEGDVATARPLIIYLHTGSFLPKGLNQLPTGSKLDSTTVAMCTDFAKKGYVVASVAYRTGWNPQGDQDTRTGTILNAVYRAMQDAKVAARYFRAVADTNAARFAVDTNNFVLCGQGSGGYVALAYATLDKVSEIQLSKFINQTTNQPYVNQAVTGDFEAYGGMAGVNKGDNHVGYSSRIKMVCNFGGAIGDSSWMEAGDVPMVSMQGLLDPFAPYTSGGVFVPGTNPPLFVVEVSGARDQARRADRLGNNNVLKTPAFTDSYTTANAPYAEGYPGLFRFNGAANASGPWEWWSPQDPFTNNGLASNPLMSKSRALLYIDTLQNFFAPRINRVLFGSAVGINESLSSNDGVKVYPNPANDQVTIQLRSLEAGETFSVEVIDAMGRLVAKETDLQVATKTINTTGLSAGMHYVRIISGNNLRVEKLMINR